MDYDNSHGAKRKNGIAHNPSRTYGYADETRPLPLPKADDLIEGTVLGQERSVLFVDLSPVGTGIIYGREYNRAKDIIRALVPGDKITVKITELENERGYFSLSLKEAKQKMVWKEAEDLQKTKTPLTLPVIDANKGGLVLEWNGVQGFLPTSQLKSSHYPRVEDGNKDKIEEELKKLKGEKLKVTIIASDQKENKLIFSEKKQRYGGNQGYGFQIQNRRHH